MAKGKNEILLSIALEGDADVKSKLKAVGEESKKALADIEKSFNAARGGSSAAGGGSFVRGFASGAVQDAERAAGRIRTAIAPILEGAGLGALGSGGLIGRLFGGAGAAAGIAGLTGLAVHLAKVREETEKADARLRGFGGSSSALDKANESARKLGTSPGSVQGDLANFLASRQRKLAEQSGVIHPPGYVPPERLEEVIPKDRFGNEIPNAGIPRTYIPAGPVRPTTESEFLAAREALIRGARLDKKTPSEAAGPVSDLLSGINSGGLTGDLLRQFGNALPNDANRLTKVLGPIVSRGFGNFDEAAGFLDRRGPISAEKLFGRLAAEGPQIAKDTAGERGLSQSFDSLSASVGRVDTAFGNLLGGPLGKQLAGGVDSVAGLIDRGAEKIPALDRQLRPTEYAPGGGQFIGPVRPEDVPRAPQSLGEVFSSDKGDLMGRLVGFIREGAQGGLGTGNQIGPPQPTNPFGAFTDFLSKAFANPGALQERARPSEGPNAFQPVPAQPASPQEQGSIFDQFLENLNAKLNDGLGQQNLKVNDPSTGLGIRGSLEDPTRDVAGSIKSAGTELASALSEVAQKIRGAGPGTSGEVTATLAGGGSARRFPGGGAVSGPGTTTSDSIPAMLSDKEYVIKASSARKLGRGALDWLNAGNYADGGAIARFAAGGSNDVAYAAWLEKRRQEQQAAAAAERERRARIDAQDEADLRQWNSIPEDIRANSIVQPGTGRRQWYADGGAVGGLGLSGSVSFPGFDIGGPVMSDAPSLADIGGSGSPGVLGHYKIDLGIPGHGDVSVMADEMVAKKLTNIARDSANFQTGQAPSWAGGR